MAQRIARQVRKHHAVKDIRGLHIDLTEDGSVETNCRTTEPGDVIDILQAIVRFIMDNELEDVLKIAAKRHLESVIEREEEEDADFTATLDMDPKEMKKALDQIFGDYVKKFEEEEEDDDVRKSQSLPS